MKTLRLLTVLALLTGFAGLASAQTYNTTTTLTNAITDRVCTNRTITVGSTTGWTAGMQAYIDWELFIVNSIPSSTTAVVQRCVSSTPPQLHSASSVVFWGAASMFAQRDTDNQGRKLAGACTASDYQFLPIIDVTTGRVYLCRAFNSSGVTPAQWTWTNSQLGTYNSLLKNLN